VDAAKVVSAAPEQNPNGSLWHRSFLFLVGSRASSTLAFQIQAVAVGWQIYALTHSTFQLGMVGLAQFLPMVLLNLVVGHVADHYNRRNIVATCQFVECGCAAFLATGSFGGWLTAPMMYGAIFVLGAARAFEGPSMQALTPGLVEKNQLPKAMALMSSFFQTAAIVGPALGGFLYALGPTACYSSTAALFLIGGLATSSIRMEYTVPRREPPTMKSIFLGINFIRSRPVVLGAISLDLFAVLLGGATALLPVFAREILHTGPWGLGLLRASPALGALLMSVTLAHRPLPGHAGKAMFGAVMAFGAATVVFAVSHWIPLSMLALFTLGASDVVSVVIRQSLVQLETPDEMRGRVSAVNSLFIGTSNQLGEFESGVTAAWWGTVPATVLGGVGSIVVAGLWMYLFPDLRKLDKLRARE
jgi:MFS family permease